MKFSRNLEKKYFFKTPYKLCVWFVYYYGYVGADVLLSRLLQSLNQNQPIINTVGENSIATIKMRNIFSNIAIEVLDFSLLLPTLLFSLCLIFV